MSIATGASPIQPEPQLAGQTAVIRQNAVRIEMEPVMISSERETEPQAPYDFAFDTEALWDRKQSTPAHFRAYEPTEQIKFCLN